jgi:hypothetical protein
MKQYIGTKIVSATPMTRYDYNVFRGWTLPHDENGDDEGFLVEYTDGGAPNTKYFPGYVSWSPKEQFDNAYREISGLSFGLAVEALKKGAKAARAGWNGKGMFIFLVPGSTFKVNRAPLLGIYPEGTEVTYQPHLDMKTADDRIVPWLASQSDVLGEDWIVVF